MHSSDSLSRAKAWIQSHARGAALAIVPLAAVVTAHAAPILNLPTAHYTCSYTFNPSGSGTCSGGANAITGSPGQIGGTALFLSGDLNLGSSGGSITMMVGGPVAGGIASGTVIPVSWDFDLNAQQSDPPWTLTYTLADTSTSTTLGTDTFSGNNSGEVTGSGSFTTTEASSAGNTLSLRIVLTESGDAEGGANVLVSIPEGTSIDVNPIGNSSVPEPASFGLLGSGLAWLGYRLRKRRNG